MITKIKDGETYAVTYNNDITNYVPKVNGKTDYEEVKEAIAGGTEKYPDAIVVEDEFTQGELDEQVRLTRIAWIDNRLDEIDNLSIRSLRSKSNGRGNAQDDTKLTELDDEAIALRTERGTLTA